MNIRSLTIVSAWLLAAACSGDGRPSAANMAPTVSSIADQTAMANQPTPAIAFTVSDEQPNALSLAVMSDNPGLLPDGSILIAGSGANRSITIAPAVDSLGDAYVTIVATDSAGLAAGTTFLLTIDAEQKSMLTFVRNAFSASSNNEPELVNAVEFAQDAESDDFTDLLSQ